MDYQYPQSSKAEKTAQMETAQTETLRKAKLKALRLLEVQDRTVAQLREKLLAAEVEPEIVEQAIAYVESFGYLDDERYVRNYIEYRKDLKSRRQLEQELQFRKGVSRELIQKVFEELEPADEKRMIRSFLKKKRYVAEDCDEKQRQKLIAALARKGFRMQDILFVMRENSID